MKTIWFQILALVALIMVAQLWLLDQPDRHELGERPATIIFAPVELAPADFLPVKLAGAWALRSGDPRFGGISALALDHREFVALTDSGVLIRFARPATGRIKAVIAELPDGPGTPKFKFNRDSEALLRDPLGRGWWVGFENRNEVWLYDLGLKRALGRIAFGAHRWPINKGIEAMAANGDEILLFPEAGRTVVHWTGKRAFSRPIDRPLGRISDATRLPGGGLAMLHRHWTPLGFANAVTLLRPAADGGLATAQSIPLGVTRLDNFEALAAEPLPRGQTRLWLITDDNLQRPLRTLLVALDVPPNLGD